MRNLLDAVLERLRGALELPAKDDLSKLSRRLDELDAKIAALAAARAELQTARTTAEKRGRKK
jgi:hypothetical protein